MRSFTSWPQPGSFCSTRAVRNWESDRGLRGCSAPTSAPELLCWEEDPPVLTPAVPAEDFALLTSTSREGRGTLSGSSTIILWEVQYMFTVHKIIPNIKYNIITMDAMNI